MKGVTGVKGVKGGLWLRSHLAEKSEPQLARRPEDARARHVARGVGDLPWLIRCLVDRGKRKAPREHDVSRLGLLNRR